MQKQNEKNINQSSSSTRTNSLSTNNRPGKNGSGKRRTDAGIKPGIGFHFLERSLQTIPLFKINRLGCDKDNVQLLSIIDTETKQLQAIEDLYAIVKAQPKYKKLKEPEWTENTKPTDILYWLLRKLGPLAGGNSWTVDTYTSGNKKRFRFVVFRDYNRQMLEHREQYIPLDFLPALKKRDLQMHDMIIDMVALVSKINSVPLWDEDGDFSLSLKNLIDNGDPGHNSVLSLQYKSYSTGPASQYLKAIKQRRKNVTAADITKQITSYNATSGRKQQLIWWIKKGLELTETKQCIKVNSYVPDYIKGNPITPFRQYKFIWSLHDHDIVKSRAYTKLKKDEKSGDFFPLRFSITKPGQKIAAINNDDFPEELYDFMSYGQKLFCYSFRDYFYKNQFNQLQTPSEQLLEKIEQFEIKNDHL